jgi:hypothetical protein
MTSGFFNFSAALWESPSFSVSYQKREEGAMSENRLQRGKARQLSI